jgi:hypothetical protein
MAELKFKSVTQMCQYLIEKYMKLEGDTVKDVVFDEDNNTITVKYNDPEKANVTFAVGVPQEVLDDITDLQENKQDKLTAGTNITITQVGDELVISSTGGGSDNAVEKSVAGTNETSTIERTMSGSEPLNLITKLKYVLSAMYPSIGCHSTIKQGGDTLSEADRIAVVIDSQSTQYNETASADRLVAFATDKVINVNVNGGKYIKTVKTDSSPSLSEKIEINNSKYNKTTDFTSSNPVKEEYELSKTEDVTIGGQTVTLNEKDKITRKFNVSNISPDVPLNDEEEIKMEVVNEDLGINGHYTSIISKKVKQIEFRYKGYNPITSEDYNINGSIFVSNGKLLASGIIPTDIAFVTRGCHVVDSVSGDEIMFNITYNGLFSLTTDMILDAIPAKLLAKKISGGTVIDVLIELDRRAGEIRIYNLTAPSTVIDTYDLTNLTVGTI